MKTDCLRMSKAWDSHAGSLAGVEVVLDVETVRMFSDGGVW